MRKLISIWRSSIKGIRNLIYWFPVIWNDRSFDHAYLYKILHHKLASMETFFRSSKWVFSMNAEDVANEICEAKEIIKRLLDDTYLDDRVADIDSADFIYINDDLMLQTDKDHPNYEKWNVACEQSDIERENDKQRLFEIMNRHIEEWWD